MSCKSRMGSAVLTCGIYVVKGQDGLYHPRNGTLAEVFARGQQNGVAPYRPTAWERLDDE